jgi:hypothetical protein
VDVPKLRFKEKVNGKVTVEALKLTKLASRFAVAVEDAKEEQGPLAKPDTSAVTLPGGDTDALAVARALPARALRGSCRTGQGQEGDTRAGR